MGLSDRYTIRNEASEGLLELLSQTTLGTNNLRYKHLDTPTRIKEADNPLFISLERDGKVQGNITLCNRQKQWYVRYFAFAHQKQASKNANRIQKTNSRLKQEMASFFDEIFNGKFGEAPESFYAFIDPANERSKWMSELFGFRTETQLISQSFSRTKPQINPQVRLLEDQTIINKILENIKANHAYYVEAHAKRGPFYAYFDENNQVKAMVKVTRVNWVIERLSGFFGGVMVKFIPFIPKIRKIVKPKNHRFLVAESVWMPEKNSQILSDLFEGVLAVENRNMLMWFVDRREPVWRENRQLINWGLYHKLVPLQVVDVVVLRQNPLMKDELRRKPIFVAGWDLV
jgi:hypothetical protein